MAERVNIDDFAHAETSRMFAAIAAQAGGTGTWFHNRTPTPLDNQPVIRQNRDTLYSACLLDASSGSTRMRTPISTYRVPRSSACSRCSPGSCSTSGM